MFKIRTLTFAALSGLPLMLASTASLAVDGKLYAGAFCDGSSPTQPFTRTEGGLENRTSSSQSYLCPAVRDIVAGTAGGITGGHAWVVDNTSSGSVTCQLQSRGPTGSLVAGVARVSATGSSPNAVKLQNFGPLNTQTDGYFVMRCTLPALASGGSQGASKIVSYRVDEKE